MNSKLSNVNNCKDIPPFIVPQNSRDVRESVFRYLLFLESRGQFLKDFEPSKLSSSEIRNNVIVIPDDICFFSGEKPSSVYGQTKLTQRKEELVRLIEEFVE